jgi:hypothetical protein
VDEEEEDNKYKNELQFNANNEALVEDIHRYSSDMIYQLERVEEALRANFNRFKINLMTEIDVELEKTNVILFINSPGRSINYSITRTVTLSRCWCGHQKKTILNKLLNVIDSINIKLFY